MPEFGTANAFVGHFWAAKFCEKIKIPKFGTKNA